MKVDKPGAIPIKSWVNDIETQALEQAVNLSNLPFAFRHIALMPDCHMGYGMPIGGVMATKNVVVPNAVGVDIGCGMCAFRTNLPTLGGMTERDIKNIMRMLRQVIPVGFKHHKRPQEWEGFYGSGVPSLIPIVAEQFDSARKQIGTLGGGNHFIELQGGSDGKVWLMIHSGSRNFGLKIANEYHKKAKELCERWFSNIPHKDLSFLPYGSEEYEEYLTAMNYALYFAKSSRHFMMKKFIMVVEEAMQRNIGLEFEIDVHHNYAVMENHFGENVLVHRKGAIRARKGDVGIIPGSQGTKSYIVKGLGNPDSFDSCSHGAGRKMSRKKAISELDLKATIAELDGKGIVHSIRNKKDLDEAPGAYKNVEEVMKAQEDLCEILVELSPLGVIKA